MKVTPTATPMIARDPGKPSNSRHTAAAAPTEAAESPAAVAKPAVPPGLERVLARLQSGSTESLTRGQANAMQHIEANIARFRDRHGIADPVTTPTEPAPADTTTPPIDATPAPSTTTDATGTATATGPAAADATPAPASDSTSVAETPVAQTPDPSIDMPTTVSQAPSAPVVAPLETTLLDVIPPAGSLIDTQA